MKSLKKKYVGDLRIGAFQNWPFVYSGITLVGVSSGQNVKKQNEPAKVMKKRIKSYEHRK